MLLLVWLPLVSAPAVLGAATSPTVITTTLPPSTSTTQRCSTSFAYTTGPPEVPTETYSATIAPKTTTVRSTSTPVTTVTAVPKTVTSTTTSTTSTTRTVRATPATVTSTSISTVRRTSTISVTQTFTSGSVATVTVTVTGSQGSTNTQGSSFMNVKDSFENLPPGYPPDTTPPPSGAAKLRPRATSVTPRSPPSLPQRVTCTDTVQSTITTQLVTVRPTSTTTVPGGTTTKVATKVVTTTSTSTAAPVTSVKYSTTTETTTVTNTVSATFTAPASTSTVTMTASATATSTGVPDICGADNIIGPDTIHGPIDDIFLYHDAPYEVFITNDRDHNITSAQGCCQLCASDPTCLYSVWIDQTKDADGNYYDDPNCATAVSTENKCSNPGYIPAGIATYDAAPRKIYASNGPCGTLNYDTYHHLCEINGFPMVCSEG